MQYLKNWRPESFNTSGARLPIDYRAGKPVAKLSGSRDDFQKVAGATDDFQKRFDAQAAELKDAWTRAREAQCHALAEQIIALADGATDGKHGDVNKRRLMCDMRRWYVARLYPKVFGDHKAIEVTGADGVPLIAAPSEPALDLSRLSLSELEQLEFLTAKAQGVPSAKQDARPALPATVIETADYEIIEPAGLGGIVREELPPDRPQRQLDECRRVEAERAAAEERRCAEDEQRKLDAQRAEREAIEARQRAQAAAEAAAIARFRRAPDS